MSTQAQLFTKDLENFHTEQKHYLDASGNFIGYNSKNFIKPLSIEERENRKISFDSKIFFKGYGTITDPTCTMDDPTLQGGAYIGLSNFNFGHITKSEEFGGTMIEDLGWKEEEVKPSTKVVLEASDKRYMNHEEFLVKGELTAPLVEAQDEQGSDEETPWQCKGCSKHFATKASLKRHHDRKKSCKEICEKPIKAEINVPEKPYIVDWVDELLMKAICGESEKPYCKHCEIEFANKTNLYKHLSKSVACDKLAKQEVVKIVCG